MTLKSNIIYGCSLIEITYRRIYINGLWYELWTMNASFQESPPKKGAKRSKDFTWRRRNKNHSSSTSFSQHWIFFIRHIKIVEKLFKKKLIWKVNCIDKLANKIYVPVGWKYYARCGKTPRRTFVSGRKTVF